MVSHSILSWLSFQIKVIAKNVAWNLIDTKRVNSPMNEFYFLSHITNWKWFVNLMKSYVYYFLHLASLHDCEVCQCNLWDIVCVVNVRSERSVLCRRCCTVEVLWQSEPYIDLFWSACQFIIAPSMGGGGGVGQKGGWNAELYVPVTVAWATPPWWPAGGR